MLSKELLEELILNINNRTGIRNEILEKDYYVCLVLKDLSKKQEQLQAYFKGGTAIYKILDHMNRFSEDIDLTVKINESESNSSNRTRLKKSALGYKIKGLELASTETIDKKGSVTSFYKYISLFNMNELFKSEKIQIESTSFTVSEPVSTYTIEPLIYKYALDNEKKILKEKYNISEFNIEIIKLERIFIDKIFAAEFYYERNMYDDVSKHLYDISIMIKNSDIKNMLKDKEELNKLINYKRKEETLRVGGISGEKEIKNFDYMKLDFDNKLINAFNKMQKIYVLDDESIITIEDVKKTIKKLLKIFNNL
ncbi:MAG: nucleotidyl transferase AbiEii/AbiGii toxin family protein [Erysipelotrichaceae bacterium]|nr:nucleotidyl transferase AbiEii/AbiGii toxin family protein [Erysipelotrichaceae bacterium]